MSVKSVIQCHDKHGGFALLIVLIVVAVGVILGMAYVSRASVKAASSRNLLGACQATYDAESGLQHALYLLQTNPSALQGTDPNHMLGPFDAGDGWGYSFYAMPVPNDVGKYKVAAKATKGVYKHESSAMVISTGNYRQLVVDSSPMGYWRLGEKSGTAMGDEMGKYNGVYSNVTLDESGALPGDSDTAAKFDGWAQFAHVDTKDFQIKQDLTVVAWVNFSRFPLLGIFPDSFVSSGDFGEGGSNNTLFQVSVNNKGNIVYKHETTWGLDQKITFDTGCSKNQWYQVTIVRDAYNRQVTCYIDGQAAGTGSYDYDPQYGQDGTLWFGLGTAPWLFSAFHGKVDDIAIYGRTLSADQVERLHDTGEGNSEFKVVNWNK